MGNSEPVNPKLKVSIETQKPFYNSGSTIEGVVIVDALQDFEYDALYLRVEGEEYCQWFEGSSKNRRKYTGHQNFYAVEHMLCKYNNTQLLQGQYGYPFSLELSQNIPGSFTSQQCDARVEYRLIAYFVNFKNKKNRSYYSVPLIIREPFRQEIYQYEGSSVQSPTICCCCKQGEVMLKAKFQRNVCFEGESIPIEIICDNTQGNSDISRFPIELVEYTFVSANSGISRTYKKVIDKQSVAKNVEKGEKSGQIPYKFIVNSVPSQSAISTLVANYYRLQVYAEVGKIAQSQPCIYAPLFVMKKQFNIQSNSKEPQDPNMNTSRKFANKKIFKAPEYWFRRNKNLDIMNFRFEDGFGSENDPIMKQP